MADHLHLRTSLRSGGSSGIATPTTATHGSQTILQTDSDEAASSVPSNTLRLRAASPDQRHRRIQWAEDVIDNEGMGKKSSKVCCIYHKPREAGDSDSDSSSSDDDSGSGSEPDLSRAQVAGRGMGRGRRHEHEHEHGHGHGDEACEKGKGTERTASPNAYERQPKPRTKKEG